jgi:hypothetical protein
MSDVQTFEAVVKAAEENIKVRWHILRVGQKFGARQEGWRITIFGHASARFLAQPSSKSRAHSVFYGNRY